MHSRVSFQAGSSGPLWPCGSAVSHSSQAKRCPGVRRGEARAAEGTGGRDGVPGAEGCRPGSAGCASLRWPDCSLSWLLGEAVPGANSSLWREGLVANRALPSAPQRPPPPEGSAALRRHRAAPRDPAARGGHGSRASARLRPGLAWAARSAGRSPAHSHRHTHRHTQRW